MMDALDPYPGNLKRHEVTSDPLAPYGKEEQRAPLFGDDEIYERFGHESDGAMVVRDHYEVLITGGELMVVKSVTYGDGAGLARNCSGCSHLSTLNESKYFNFCPGCGAKIIK